MPVIPANPPQYPPNFIRALAQLFPTEGIFSDDPSDSGGATKYGVTEGLARRYGYTGKMPNLTYKKATYILYAEFWHRMRLDAVGQIVGPSSEYVTATTKDGYRLQYELFECGMNMGHRTSIRFLQVVLNALNNRGTLWADLVEDGLVGGRTIGALNSLMQHRGRNVAVGLLLAMLNSLQGARYIELSRQREKDEKYVAGWFLHRVKF